MTDTNQTPEEPIEPAPVVEESKGLGDVVADALNAVGGQTVADFVSRVTKKPCNCGQRQQRLNELGSNVTAAAKSTTDYIRQRVLELSRKGNNQ